jgi:hypothetical protein
MFGFKSKKKPIAVHGQNHESSELLNAETRDIGAKIQLIQQEYIDLQQNFANSLQAEIDKIKELDKEVSVLMTREPDEMLDYAREFIKEEIHELQAKVIGQKAQYDRKMIEFEREMATLKLQLREKEKNQARILRTNKSY